MSDHIINLIQAPHVSEKATLLGEKCGQYVFKVRKDSNKADIKKAIESSFGVNVESVRVMNSKPLKIRMGRIQGTRKAWKKAIVSLKKGEAINFGGTES